MSTAAIVAVAACALIGWCALVQAVKEILVARTQPPACPCRDLHSISVGAPTVTEFSADGGSEVATEHRRIVVAAGKVH
ncbi:MULTISPECIES: hypothetical protein [Methylobacterium]|uniref:Uncharacterized protein n=1 Tax=Methylobacterium radiotolerans (strain ATCC 27329 / DSM 1819 / JCM 2831 / NBRC 15690 / NCIMB 10815 / 0-1) TaxID=426355 RepID=B1M178_METRJ|nr:MULTISPECIES: hypothetical protein [Methylobacterium]ACB24628.1 hypothetical protein Mrad2831_2644 [Methylobacterium radiotolerans JCM 2831]MBE7248534.1 hypothetical protein [Actinomycetospora chiangmaiensis]GEM97099.1 hypothetical protein MRA01_16390 [Methylobacterium radiotolerans]